MKRVLVVNSHISSLNFFDLDYNNKRIIQKRNKTLIKDGKYINSEFTDRLNDNGISWELLMEEWEVFNPEKLQLCMDNNYNPIKPRNKLS